MGSAVRLPTARVMYMAESSASEGIYFFLAFEESTTFAISPLGASISSSIAFFILRPQRL
jgi:hypothetical protein